MHGLAASSLIGDEFSPSAILRALDETPQVVVSQNPRATVLTIDDRVERIRAQRGVENRGSCNWSGWGN
jgi:hypothetical protein